MTWTLVCRNAALGAALLLTSACGSAKGSGSGGTVTSAPSVRPVESIRFSVYSHCGIESARIDGHWWHADPPLYNDERTGPPEGWDNPYQEGRLTVESAERAVFEALGQQIVFVPAPDNQPVRICR
jgi:hypothetical protein